MATSLWKRGRLFWVISSAFLLIQGSPSSALFHSFLGNDILDALNTSCVLAVTERARSAVFNVVQYLADVSFADEEAVAIGFMDLDQFIWPNGQPLSWKQIDQDVKDIVYFSRKKVDRTCLLSQTNELIPKVEAYLGNRNVIDLVQFINTECGVYCRSDGFLNNAGLHRQEILNQLFCAKHITDVNMGKLYGLNHQFVLFNRSQEDNVCYGLQHSSGISQYYMHPQRTAKKRIKIRSDSPTQTKILKGDTFRTKQAPQKTDYLHSKKHATMAECEIVEMPSESQFFHEYLKLSKPMIIKDAIRQWPAWKRWTNQYLRDNFGEEQVHVKLTPVGEYEGVESADIWEDFETFSIPQTVLSKLLYPDLVVVRPATADIKFSDFLDLVGSVSKGSVSNFSAYLEYFSISSHFAELLNDVEEMPFIKDKLELRHENIWLSDGNTLGKLHFDPFDNFLCQISGKKEVIMFDPHDNTELYEGHIPEAILGFNKHDSTFRRKTLADSTSMVMSPVDILKPNFERFPKFANAYPMNCTIDEGDVLFMPSFWWHEVQSYPNVHAGRNLAVNFWYEPFLTREFPCQECILDINPLYRHLL